MKEKIILALDVSSAKQAVDHVRELHDLVGMFKVGSQLFMAEGPPVVREIVHNHGKVFLDLKFHDIPNTVTHAVVEAAKLGVSMMTIHAAGGRSMMQSVSRKLNEEFGNKRPMVVAITVLTSFDTKALFEIGLERPIEEQVQHLALFAQECGIDGVVCSPREIAVVRRSVHPNFKIVTPGIRMPDQALNDQQRTATPKDAIAGGADYIVVGRAVTDDPRPRDAMQRLMDSIR
jgi:orotidine-5'-phosphate decarboxylase